MNHVIEILQLDPTANLKRMSKGMKQKTAIVAALMGEKEILVLDEPTTGLDPLMREAFLGLVREESRRAIPSLCRATFSRKSKRCATGLP